DLRAFALSVLFFFFFSSRRRHTRFSRDWSSDVCSSDLGDDLLAVHVISSFAFFAPRWSSVHFLVVGGDFPLYRIHVLRRDFYSRSEERRVGKECRFRGVPSR